MFGLSDLVSLIISAFIILPVVILLRQMGYVLISEILGVENPRLTIGSGPRVFKWSIFDVRKYYHLYSWFSYDSLKKEGEFAYISLYAAPILINIVVAVTINLLIANEVITEYLTFFDRFIFYAFYYVLFDIVPMKTANGMPNNGWIIYEMIRYGKRTDYNEEPFIPSTTEVEEEYEEEMEKIEEIKEHKKEEAEQKSDTKQEEKRHKEAIESEKRKEKQELAEEKKEQERGKKE
ncbi:hypothetical protein [Planomicrobium sp. YIM 101495]|uniref:hypothetical protein n=1 Tax=Planomicrobium sp. YIM 101495 TaxID=2665160 RepID=UPI0012B6EA34|nr:hypothetical protein [Planomicrobium sp. YIM 101495]MTD31405.1 hypothetical protein [Planomicrobium sp. YIM 101495]